MEQFTYANQEEQVKKINKYLSTSMMIFDALIFGVVIISMIQGKRSIAFGIIMAVVMLVTCAISIVMVKRNPGTHKMKYVTFAGMFFIMFYLLLVGRIFMRHGCYWNSHPMRGSPPHRL